MGANLTASEAVRLLMQAPDEYGTPEALRSLASQVSVAPLGGVQTDRVVFYSGPIERIPGGVDAWTMARSIQLQDAKVSIIDTTERGMFLDTPQFKQAVVKAFAHEGVRDFEDLRSRRDTQANQFLFDATQGIWADASQAFAEAASGDVTTLSCHAPEGRTFALVELPALLVNPAVQRVNGVNKSVLQALAKTAGGMQAVLKAVAETSRQKLLAATLIRDDQGLLVGVDTTALLDVPPARGRPEALKGKHHPIQAGALNATVLQTLAKADRHLKKLWVKRVLG